MKRRFYTILLLTFLFASCQQEAPSKEKEPSNRKMEETTEKVEPEIIEEEEDLRSFNYYAGTIGLYGEDVLIEVNQEDLKLTGRYWYLKHGKEIALEGEASAKSGEWQLKETVKGVVTGNMTLLSKGDALTGQWYAPGRKSELQEVELTRVYTSEKGPVEPNFEEFSRAKTISMYNGETDDVTEEEASDDIRLVHIGDYVLFQCFVIGSNAHVGHINGLAKFDGNNKAIYQGEEGCLFSITFKGDQVTIAEDENCNYYRGMRAYFDGTLDRVN